MRAAWWVVACLVAWPSASLAASPPAMPSASVVSHPPAGRLAPVSVTEATADRNKAHPRFSPDGKRLSYEQREGQAQAILVVDPGAPEAVPARVTSAPHRGPVSAEDKLLGVFRSDDSFNGQLTFFPDGDRFAFTGNGGAGVYRIYEGSLSGGDCKPVTGDSKEDGHPAVSPDGRYLAYVSARGGVGKLFLREIATGKERALTKGPQVDLYPAWSPDSRAVAYTSGDNDNHDVFVIPDVTAPDAAPRQLTMWKYDDLRPTFSPDGSMLAYYSNYNAAGDEREWSIVAVPALGTGPTKGAALAKLVAATNVVKDPEVGPAWLPQGRAIVFARNVKAEFNPIYVVDLDTHDERRIETGTKMNHDLTCSPDGRLAFRAQVASWDNIFVVRLLPEAGKP